MRRLLLIAMLVGVGCDPDPEPASPSTPPATPATTAAKPDVAELDIPNLKRPYHGVVTAGQPTTEHFAQLKGAGYTAVVNLRADGEPGYRDEMSDASRELILYKHLPIRGPEDLTKENVQAFADILATPTAKNGDVLVHCGTGNRAGAMVALKAAWIDGRSAADSLELGRRAGLAGLEPTVKELLAGPP